MKDGNYHRNHFFDEFMSGKRISNHDTYSHNSHHSHGQTGGQFQSIEQLLKGLDFDELFENIDTVMDTAKQFKPYVAKLSPFLDKILKK